MAYILELELSVENRVLDLLVNYVLVSSGCALIEFVVDYALDDIGLHIQDLFLPLRLSGYYFLRLLSAVKKNALQHIDEVPHVRTTHLAVQLLHKDVDAHHGVENVYELSEEEIKGEAHIRDLNDFTQEVLTILVKATKNTFG